jgi:tetratricopeptide (TPR) repeat protein
MRTRFEVFGACFVAAAFSAGCADIQARWAFKEANKKYEEEDYREAIPVYERALQHRPDMAAARFYLASAHQALYRPTSKSAENREHLDIAVREYKQALADNPGGTPNLDKVKANTIAVLTGIYSDDPYRDFDQAYNYAQMLVELDPNDTKNLYAMANLYEKFGKVDEAQKQYERIVELNPDDTQACGALAAFYNKPLWEGQSKFDLAIDVLQRCAELAPDDPQGYQKVATFYWDKAYRDPLIGPEEKDAYADKGLEAVDKALELKPDYFEAYVFKGLLYRVKAGVASSSRLRQQYLEEAEMLQKRGLELKEEQEEDAAAAEAAAAIASGG